MRLPIGLAAMASIFLLGSAVVASTVAAPQAANATDASMGPTVVINTSGDVDERASELDDCVSGAATHLPEGADATAFCTCAVNKIANGTTQPAAIAQCAAELHVTGMDPRANEIRECVSGSPGHLPAGTDANAFCTCAVDKMMLNNAAQTDAVNQCAMRMHITLPNQE